MNFRSPFPDVVIPHVSVYEYLFGDLDEADQNHVALIDAANGTELTYGDLVRCVNAFARALTLRGIDVGDVVAVLSPNTADFAVAFHGVLAAGATATTINVLSTAEEIAGQLQDSRARLLFTIRRLRRVAEKAAVAAGLSAIDVIVLDGDDAAAVTTGVRPKVDFDPAVHVAVLPYSSGTTGKPKGVMLSHRNLVANTAQVGLLTCQGPEETLIAVIPFFHSYGLTAPLCAALRGRSRLIVMSEFDLTEFLANIQKYQCTQAYIAPPVAVALAKHPIVESFDLSSLRTLISAAASLDEELAGAVTKRLGYRVVQAYGMSELSPASHIVPHDGGLGMLGIEAPLNSCGWTVPNSESKLIDVDTGQEVSFPNEGLSKPGELCFRGPTVMAGYLGNREATEQIIDADGFLRTGDLARVDVHGCVYIVDRVKELIKYKGYQVPPAELEALLLTHRGIADAAVVGAIDADSGEEIPKAFVVRQANYRITEEHIINFVAERVAPYKKVRRVDFIDSIPKSATGKILRKKLRGGP